MTEPKRNSPGWYARIPLMAIRKARHLAAVARDYNALYNRSSPALPEAQAFYALLDRAGGGQSIPEMHHLYTLARQAARLEGDMAELGVYQGRTAKMLAQLAPSKRVHLFDTFEGMPAVDQERDRIKAGVFGDTSQEAVQRHLADCPNVRFHSGLFPETAAPVEDQLFCFVHLDADIYQSTRSGIEFFYPRMVPGGIMAFHDYTQHDCPGVRQAIEEFFGGKPEPVIYLPPNQCCVVKV